MVWIVVVNYYNNGHWEIVIVNLVGFVAWCIHSFFIPFVKCIPKMMTMMMIVVSIYAFFDVNKAKCWIW